MKTEYLYQSIQRFWKLYLFLGLSLYTLLGYAHHVLLQHHNVFKYYVITSSVTFLFLTSLGRLLESKNDHQFIGRLFSIASTCVMANLILVVVATGSSLLNLYFVVILGLGVMDLIWLMSRRLVYYNYMIAVLPIFYVALTLDFRRAGPEVNIMIIIPVVALILWRIVSSIMQGLVFKNQVDHHRLGAYQSTVVSLKHEFRNTVSIINILLKRKEGRLEETQSMLERNLKRVLELIEKVSSLTKYKETSYLGKTKMVDFDSEKR